MAPPVPKVILGDDPSALAEQMDHLATVGRGWINVMPQIPEDVEVPPTPGILAIFNKRGPAVPLGTWTASNLTNRGAEPSEVGVQHGAGRGVHAELAGTPGEIPEGWRMLQDHPRRGLVARPAPGTPHIEIATWLLDVLGVLCLPPRTANFLVYVYET